MKAEERDHPFRTLSVLTDGPGLFPITHSATHSHPDPHSVPEVQFPLQASVCPTHISRTRAFIRAKHSYT